MSKSYDEAKAALSKANEEFNRIIAYMAEHLDTEDFNQAHRVYETAAQLNVLTSQIVDQENPRTIEGTLVPSNVQAMVSINGFEIRGSVKFELKLSNGEWDRGHRENSQYGQVFIGRKGGVILTDGMQARVTFPLAMDDGY